MRNEKLPALTKAINADLVPRVKKWLSKHYPEVNFSGPLLDDLMCYAISPEDFFMPTATNAICDHRDGKLKTADGALKLLPDRGLIEIHESMKREPLATVAALAQFQHEHQKYLKNTIRRAVRRENTEGFSNMELVSYLIDSGQISADKASTAEREIRRLRNDDLENISPKDWPRYRTGIED
jgi:hypothetical protein